MLSCIYYLAFIYSQNEYQVAILLGNNVCVAITEEQALQSEIFIKFHVPGYRKDMCNITTSAPITDFDKDMVFMIYLHKELYWVH